MVFVFKLKLTHKLFNFIAKNGAKFTIPAPLLPEGFWVLLGNPAFWSSMVYSFLVVLPVVCVAVSFATLAGYVLAKHKFLGRTWLFAIFVLQMTRTQAKRKEDELGEDHTVLKERLVTSQWAVAIAILALAVYGHILYIGKKRIEFRGKFSYFKLFKGTVCRNVDEREYGWAESLKAFFGVFENPAPAKVRTQTPLLTGDFFDNGSDISE